MHNAHGIGGLIDREEHAVHVRAAAVVEHANWLVRVEALWRDLESLWELLQRENRSLETAEPRYAPAWRSLDDPEIQLF